VLQLQTVLSVGEYYLWVLFIKITVYQLLLNTVSSPVHFIPTRILGHLDNDDILFSAVGWL
jgi:hypothetical protein